MTSADGVTMEGAPRRRRWLSKGYLVTMGTVLVLGGGIGLTVLGLGSADQAVASYDGASWVWSQGKGEVARINGITAKVDTRVDVTKARGHDLQISQDDRFVILRDVTTGAIGTMDLTSLQAYWNGQSTAGLGVQVALQNDAAFVVDTVQGQVQQIDPRNLAPIGSSITFPPGITGGVFDGKNRLWVAVPSEGTVTAITPAPLTSGSPGTGGAQEPQKVRTIAVAGASHDLNLSTLDDGVAVLDGTTDTMSTIVGDATPVTTSLTLTGPAAVPARTVGAEVPVTVADSRQVTVVGSNGGVSTDFTVPGAGSTLEPAVAWQGFIYVADSSNGTVHVFDSHGKAQPGITFKNPGGPLELDVREGYLFINAPGSSIAQVVDDTHHVRAVNKYANDVLGGDPPPVPPKSPDPPAPPKPVKPVISKPGEPRDVRAAAGNASATVTWQPAADNGAPILRYVVTGAGQTFQVGADQRSLTVPGLTNGQQYAFSVYAVNKKGNGPAKTSNPVVPTSEVPDPPASITAVANPDGSATVTWPAANGEGLAIKGYTVTAISSGGSAPIGNPTGTSLSIPAGQLQYGQQYAFTVTSINAHGAGSKPSPVSASIVPFTKPDKPENVTASTDPSQSGAIDVSWTAPADNGRPISKYVVSAGGNPVDVASGTTTTLTGFGADQSVTVTVAAVNDGGTSDAASAEARTVAAPKVATSSASSTWDTATVSFTTDKGGAASVDCTVAQSGGSSQTGCSSHTFTGLKPGTAYSYTITVKNVAGQATGTVKTTTADLEGTATCIDGQNGDTATYCDTNVPGRNGDEIFSVTSQDNAKQVGWVKDGTKLQAYCKKEGDSIYAYIYNHNKRSTWWIQVNYSGRNYIPWAWLNFSDDQNTLNALPTC